MSTVEEQVAEALRAHELDLGALRRDRNTEAGYWLVCRCGFEWTPVGPFDQHRAHVATVLASLIAERERDAAQEAHDAICEYSAIEAKAGLPCTYTGVVYAKEDK